MNKFIRFFKDKAQAFRVAMQAGKLRELVELKKGRQFKKEKSTKKPYEWGAIGLSTVSAEIKKDNHGLILNRRERKQLSKQNGVPFVRYYNEV